MKTIKASEFKAKCLGIIDEIAKTGEEVVVTKNGKPMTRMLPYKQLPESPIGLHKGLWKLEDDLVESVGETWEAEV